MSNNEKQLIINGMMCQHCSMTVEKKLKEIDGVESCNVDLDKKTAYVSLSKEVSDETFKNVITDAGYELVEVK